jgi:type II secretion system protein H
MPILATGSNRRFHPEVPRRAAVNGFTLIELMVVIAIMGAATAIVVLNLPESRATLRVEAEAFAARTLAARDAAIIESRDMAVWVTRAGYGIEQRRHGAWQPLTKRPFAPTAWRAGTVAQTDGASGQRIVFDTTGAAAAPQTITLAHAAVTMTIMIADNGDIRVGP